MKRAIKTTSSAAAASKGKSAVAVTAAASAAELAAITAARGAEVQHVGVGVRMQVQVKPAAKHNDIFRIDTDAIHVRIAAPAQEGRANDELVSFLSEQLHVRQSQLHVLRGSTGRTKTLLVAGVSVDELRTRLTELRSSLTGADGDDDADD